MAAKAPNQADPAEDAITGEEISSTTIPTSKPGKGQNPGPARNAFSELLSPSKKQPSKHTSSAEIHSPPTTLTTFTGRAGLGAYTADPGSFPASRVISYNDDFVIINDLYPKSFIHLLLLPRNPQNHLLHPFEALQDPIFLSSVQQEVRKLRTLVAKELQRRFGKLSSKEKQRENAVERMLMATEELDESQLPLGRDWSREVISGVHTHPSMTHLHIHVLSRDHRSPCMRHRKHYNSFATDFLVDVEDFPLTAGDAKRRRKAGFLDEDLVCWRCGRNFGNKFAKLKHHLEGEFEEWKSE
ncbi:MAG: hypothetical protein Q9182_003427 [Xanthomendoza sp. 2 TL-2023]